ncbi:hypothetical protein T439DRAFT_322266 [Meredithblackwellia eburnea MCA 4105]
MSSYSSTSSFLSGKDSELSTSPSDGVGGFDQAQPPSLAAGVVEDEPLDHPLLSNFNKDVVVTDKQGFPVMQTKSAWEKQMKEKAKEDAKKAKKLARQERNSGGKKKAEAEPPKALSKKEKKAKKLMGDDIVDEDA